MRIGLRSWGTLCLAIATCIVSQAKQPHAEPSPDRFEIGRRTFFDFGPPFNYYEIFLVRSLDGHTSIQRIRLTPPGIACFSPATLERASVLIDEPITRLLNGKNPCSIPEKELRRERKRCKKCLVFSGADVSMRVQCQSGSRVIRSDILDRDIFDPGAHTPEHTSWTMQLLSRMDQSLGNTVMDKPVLQIGETQPNSDLRATELSELTSGMYDDLFKGAPDKPSDLYRSTQIPVPVPSVRILSSTPFEPLHFVGPLYPAIAKAAHVEGVVTFEAPVDANGLLGNPVFEDGSKLLQKTITDAVSQWTFPNEASGKTIRVSLEFKLNCPALESK